MAQDFLSITFDGGRFVRHTMPVAAMGEFATMERLLAAVGRELFLQRNPARQRVDAGFGEAAALHFVTSEHNCFTARLERGGNASKELIDLFDEARQVVLDALEAVQQGNLPGSTFPLRALSQLAAVGKFLEESESLAVKHGAHAARVDRTSRQRLAQLTHQSFEFVGAVEGEVVKVDDAGNRFIIRQHDTQQQFDVPYDIHQRSLVMEALQARPMLRVRARGTVVVGGGFRMKLVDELELIEDARAEEITQLRERIATLRHVPDGWFGGQGLAPATGVLDYALRVLTRLLVATPALPRPAVFPAVDGGVQAEWLFASWSVDAHFSPDEGISLSAAHIGSEAERDGTFSANEVTPENVQPLRDWMLTTSETAVDRA